MKGHVEAITDLHYSHLGDRLLSGSQKDGVVRIWSWDYDPTIPDSRIPGKERGLRNVVIKLTNPIASSKTEARKTRRRGAGASTANNNPTIELDVAIWSNDDSRVITSQSIPLRNGNGIVPNSCFLFVWDSHSGHCLLGIAQPHTLNCQVLFTHPSDPSIFASASKELKVWDIETGKKIEKLGSFYDVVHF